MAARGRTNKPVIPFIQLYDHVGGQVFTSTGQYHTWDTASFKTSDMHYTIDEDAVFINNPSTGYYEVTFECSYSTVTVGQNATTSQLYVNGAAIEGSKSVLCVYYAGGQSVPICGTQTLHFVLYLKAGDKVQMKTSTNAGCGVASYPDSSRLLIKFIPTFGWDNNHGGKINYRGEVFKMSDMRMMQTFYGICVDDWLETFGSFSDHHYLLVKEYINEGCNCTETSTASDTHEFLYPHHIKKTYFIEGVINGHVTFASSTATAYLCSYRVTVCKVHEDTTETELFTTGWVTINDTLGWNAGYNIPSVIEGEEGELVYPFEIDAWEKEKLDEFERIYLKVESTCSDDSNFVSCAESSCTNVILWHANDATWTDLKITIPFVL